MLLTKVSQLTGKTNTMELPIEQKDLDAYYESDDLIQVAFPYLSADQREFILTGATQAEWDEAFPETEE